MKIHIKAPLPSGPGGKGVKPGKPQHGTSMPSSSWMEKQMSKPGPKFPKAPKTGPGGYKYSAKAEASLRAGGSGGKKFQKSLKVAAKGGRKARHKGAGPGGGQFF